MAGPSRSGLQESSTTNHKRKNPADETGTGRVVKHRSSQACQSCRTRKVRCDVVTNGPRCTNCRLDNLKCIVVASKRGKSNNARHHSTKPPVKSPPPRPAEALTSDPTPHPTKTDDWQRFETTETHSVSGEASQVPVCVTFDEDVDRTRSDQRSRTDNAIRSGPDYASSKSYHGLLSPESAPNLLNHPQTLGRKVSLPPFIAPLSNRLVAEDLDFLLQKGATTVPEHDLCMEVIRGYFSSVHPCMPMLDVKAFLDAVTTNREDNQISLLLFQAVMFAGVHSLQLHVIHRLGFESAKQARNVFFERTMLLYEFDAETDSATILQSLVLMSLWYGKWYERKHTWHWTGLAYDVARSMGLHREPTTKYASEKIRRFRRRLWWSLYIRDRLIALGTRRPMRIRDDEFNVSMLTLDDFDIDPSDGSSQEPTLMPSTEESTSIALMCIQLAKLCVCVGRVVSSQYTVLNNQTDAPPTMMVLSKRNGGHTKELENCDKELDEWFQTLSTNVRRTSSSAAQDNPQSCVEVHWAILNVAYLTTVNVLHRAQALLPMPESVEAQAVHKSSKSKVKDSARGLTTVLQTMLGRDQVRYISPLGVTALMAASLSHMLDISSGDADVRDASTFRLYQSLQVLQQLREIYASADASISFLTSITRKAGIPVPALSVPATDNVATPAEDLATRSTSRSQNADWKSSRDSPARKRALSKEQDDALSAALRVDPSQTLKQSADGVIQPRTLLNRDNLLLNATGAAQPNAGNPNLEPSAALFAMSKPIDTAQDISTTNHRTAPFSDPTFRGPLHNAADGPLFETNNGMDTPGIDFESLAFNFDFYSNAFGVFNGDPQDAT